MQKNESRPLNFAPAMQRFLAHQSADPHAITQCFARDATVHDEAWEHRGRTAIAAWNAQAMEKFCGGEQITRLEIAP